MRIRLHSLLAPTSLLLCAALTGGCVAAEDSDIALDDGRADLQPTSSLTASVAGASAASLGLLGNPGDVTTTTQPGTVLMGGGTDVDAAIKWMISKSGGGDFVVIRATGADGYNSYIYSQLGGVDSVETLLINSLALANDPAVITTLRNAEAVFIAGGDQANYVRYWRNTPVEDALNYLRNTKKVPIGGTSAGCAIQGEAYFTAEVDTIQSAEALANPYDRRVTLGRSDFLQNPYLENTITDTHYNNPDRRGRHITFMARMATDWGWTPRGIGVDEKTAVAIDGTGRATVFGEGYAFFIQQYGDDPERCVSGSSLDWFRNRRALEVYKVRGTTQGDRWFDLYDWNTGSGGSWQYYYVDRGSLGISY